MSTVSRATQLAASPFAHAIDRPIFAHPQNNDANSQFQFFAPMWGRRLNLEQWTPLGPICDVGWRAKGTRFKLVVIPGQNLIWN